MQKLIKQLKKEVKANPGRSAVLAIVTVVAIYFWAPLVMKWSGLGKGAKPTEVATAPVASNGAVSSTPTVAAPTIATPFRWESFLQRIAGDNHMASASLPQLQHNPFETKVRSEADADLEAADELPVTIPVAAKTPFDQLGLRLQSTLVSSKGGVAMIDGKLVSFDAAQSAPQWITIPHAGTDIEVRLLDVRHREVELEYDGESHVLTIEEDPRNSGSVQRH